MSSTLLKSLIAASALMLGIQAAAAGADAVRAKAFFGAIAGGNAETVTSFYADKAALHWLGGPLDGAYQGKDQIRATWEQFIKASSPTGHKVLALSESGSGAISTIAARVAFTGENDLPVKFTLIFENGAIVEHIWELDKAKTYATTPETRENGKAEAATQNAASATPRSEPASPVSAAEPVETASEDEPSPQPIAAPETDAVVEAGPEQTGQTETADAPIDATPAGEASADAQPGFEAPAAERAETKSRAYFKRYYGWVPQNDSGRESYGGHGY